MRILYTGGGTMGSVSPLIAIQQQLKSEALWIGTKNGVEKEIVEKQGIKFKSITAGKLRRYFDLQNITDVFKIIIGFFQALFIILKFQPDVIMSAGSFVSVPVVWAAWFNNVPCIIHQQDVQAGLANKLMTPVVARVTVALEKSLGDYSSSKAALVGNPVRQGLGSKEVGNKEFDFNNDLPILLVMGGGTGALDINKLIWESLDELTKFYNIIHLAGKSKTQITGLPDYQITNYKQIEFLGDEIYDAMQVADVVISRAGMSALTELAYFSKPTIIIPLPKSHQIKNAEYFANKNACVYLKQDELDKVRLVREIKKLLENRENRTMLSENINKVFIDYSGEKIIEIIKDILLKN